MSKVKQLTLAAAVMLAAAGAAHAETIDELTEAARQAKLSALRNSASAAITPASATGPNGVPVPAPVPAPDAAPVRKKRSVQAEPYLLSIYGVDTHLIAEIEEDSGAAKYMVGDKTATGWTVAAIGKRSVQLEKTGKGKKVSAKKTLSFWTPVENSDDNANTTGNGSGAASKGPMAMVNPPYPPGMFGK